MRLVVCLKAVPREAPHLRAGVLEVAGGPLVLNESDEYALETALALKRASGGELIAASAGPLASQEVLYQALAKGANRAVRIEVERWEEWDAAEVLARAAQRLQADLVLTGVEAYDDLAGQVGPAIAAHLDVPFASAVVQVEWEPGQVHVVREMGAGFRQRLALPFPALVAVLPGICPLSYTPALRLLEARRMSLEVWQPEDLGVQRRAKAPKRIGVEPPREERAVQFLEGTHEEVARIILEKIAAALGTP